MTAVYINAIPLQSKLNCNRTEFALYGSRIGWSNSQFKRNSEFNYLECNSNAVGLFYVGFNVETRTSATSASNLIKKRKKPKPSQDFFKRVFHHAKLRGLSHMGISFPKADTSWTSKFFSTYWRQRLVCCMCGTSAHLVLKTLAGDALVEASLKTGARGARDFVHSYGRDGFVTPIATLARTDRQTIAQGENKWIKI